MLFADDIYFYCKADSNEALKVLELLNVYEKAADQKVNSGKSSIFFSSNVIVHNRQEICRVLQMVEANEHSTYLGLPNISGRNKSAILGYLKDKVNTRIKTWDGNFISRSVKEILIKTVVQALPTYVMNVFLLPLEIIKDMERSLSKFWWQTTKTNNSCLSWMSWDRMAQHKSVGGLGF